MVSLSGFFFFFFFLKFLFLKGNFLLLIHKHTWGLRCEVVGGIKTRSIMLWVSFLCGLQKSFVWFIYLWDELRMWRSIHLLPQSKYFPVKYFVVIKFLTNSDINLVSGKNINKTGYKTKCQRQSAWGRRSTHTHTQCVAVTEFSMPEAKARERDRERTGVKPQAVVRRDV